MMRPRADASPTPGRRRRARLIGALGGATLALATPCVAKSLGDLRARLDGTWSGDRFTMVLDADRSQANLDPGKPFQWDAFKLLDVAGTMLTFEIGATRYVGQLNPDGSMSLVRIGVPGRWMLHRAPPSRP